MSANHYAKILHQVEQFVVSKQFAPAIALLNQTLKSTPNFYQAWLKLSECLYKADYYDQAIEVARHAENFDPLTQAFDQIRQCMQAKAYTKAIEIAGTMLKQIPHHPRAVYTIAQIYLMQNKAEQSAELLKTELPFLPANLSLRNLLIDSYVQSNEYQAALDASRALAELKESFDALWKWIGLLQKYSQLDLLLEVCERADKYVQNNPLHYSQLSLIKGQALRILGKRKLSVESLKTAIKANPKNVEAWAALADMKNYVFSKSEINQIEALIQDPGLTSNAKAIATFALAKAVELQEGLEQSMPFYKKANALVGSHSAYTQAMIKEFELRKSVYTKANLLGQSNKFNEHPKPIFIVGMPRSGSTLIEQILASHSSIEATIEQPTLQAVEQQAEGYCKQKYGKSLYECLPYLTGNELSLFGKSYLEKGAIFREQNLDYFIDKQPFNFRLIGFIHKILPNAIIIDIRRNPMDCGLSLYKQYFYSGVQFSYHLKQIALVLNAYQDLMHHWHTVLPNRIVTLEYEELINSPESFIKALLLGLSLPFEEACVDFSKNTRKVHTASSEQVRQPINQNSMGIWKRVAIDLKDLSAELVNSSS